MCGIAGCIGVKDVDTINRMLDALPHRGPNDRGLHTKGKTVFGHTRLSIVDVAHGHQPIIANGGSRGIICNGEIYNFNQIRERLKPRSSFKTRSDTEVILQLYREKGTDCVKDLDGMFAFAIFDEGDFMLARDPIGIKPSIRYLCPGWYGFSCGKASERGHFSTHRLVLIMVSDVAFWAGYGARSDLMHQVDGTPLILPQRLQDRRIVEVPREADQFFV